MQLTPDEPAEVMFDHAERELAPLLDRFGPEVIVALCARRSLGLDGDGIADAPAEAP